MHNRRFLVLVGAGLALFLAAWVASTPPFGAPDEQAHYLRALTITNGDLLGPKVAEASPPRSQTPAPGWLRAQQAWNAHDTRAVFVQPKLSPPSFPCLSGAPGIGPRGCGELTYTGDYPPLAYLLPAVALRVAPNSTTGDWLARAASAVLVGAFLLASVALMSEIGPWALLGLLVAVTPMVLFIGSVLNSSGLEIAASLACAAAALRIATAQRPATRWVWATLGVSGAVAILAWQLGPVFVLLSLLASAGLGGRDLMGALRARGGLAAGVGLALAAALAISLVWGLTSGLFHGTLAFTPLGSRLSGGFSQLAQGVLPGLIGDFGTLSVRLPRLAYWLWWLGGLGLIGAALLVGRSRDRIAVGASLLVAVAFAVLFYAFVYEQSGFGMQGRYVLPVFMLVPLISGVAIERGLKPRGRPFWTVAVGAAAVGCFQLFAWWINARHSAGEPGAVWFLAHPRWSPPAGWWLWAGLAAAGTALVLAAAASYRWPSGPPILGARRAGPAPRDSAARTRRKDDPGRAGGRPGTREKGAMLAGRSDIRVNTEDSAVVTRRNLLNS